MKRRLILGLCNGRPFPVVAALERRAIRRGLRDVGRALQAERAEQNRTRSGRAE